MPQSLNLLFLAFSFFFFCFILLFIVIFIILRSFFRSRRRSGKEEADFNSCPYYNTVLYHTPQQRCWCLISSFMKARGFCHFPLSTVACVCPEPARWVDWWSVEFTAAAGGWWFGLWDNFMHDKVGHKHVLSFFGCFCWVWFETKITVLVAWI